MAPALRDFVGVVPAAGCGSRLGGRLTKELLPVLFAEDEAGARPIPVAEWVLGTLARAGLRRALVVVSPGKPELLRVLGDGAQAGLDLAYVVQESPSGLAAAVRAGAAWLDGPVCLALPDTVFAPEDAPARVGQALVERQADLVLGLFPTDEPELLGPVVADPDGRVRAVLEKPTGPAPRNTWGLAAWSPRFTRFLVEALGDDWRAATTPLGLVFHAAAQAGLAVQALELPDARYRDLGTPAGLASLLRPRPPA